MLPWPLQRRGSERVEEWRGGKWVPGGATFDEFVFAPPVGAAFAARLGIPPEDLMIDRCNICDRPLPIEPGCHIRLQSVSRDRPDRVQRRLSKPSDQYYATLWSTGKEPLSFRASLLREESSLRCPNPSRLVASTHSFRACSGSDCRVFGDEMLILGQS